MAGERIRTTIPEIVDYWAKHTGECGLSVDFAEAHEQCWRCDCQRVWNAATSSLLLWAARTRRPILSSCVSDAIWKPQCGGSEVMWVRLRAYGVPF